MLIVTELTQTCPSCPTQWEGRTADGGHIYARYRFGYLRVGTGPTLDAAVERAMHMGGPPLYAAQVGDEYDGQLDYARLVELTCDRVAWPA